MPKQKAERIRFLVDCTSSLPAYVQIKEQIKVAYALGQLKQGDLLPSVRAMAKRLHVGEAIVRRAYKELCELRILETERGKHVAVNQRLATPARVEMLMARAERVCERLIDWAHEAGFSTVSLARLLMRKAAASELAEPSYIYVDAGTALAARLAERISRAWGISIQPLSIDTIEPESLRKGTTLIVNSYRHEQLLECVGGRDNRVFPLRVKQSDRLIRKIRQFPIRSKVLLVHPDEDFPRVGRSVSEALLAAVGKDLIFEAMPLGQIEDLAELAASGEYRLIIVSVLVWDTVPEKPRRMSTVVCSQIEPDMESLEEIRLLAGVLL